MPILLGAAGVVAILIGVVVYLIVRPVPLPPAGPSPIAASTPAVSAPVESSNSPAPVNASSGAAFANVPLPSGPVVYLLDQSQANEDFLATVKLATYKSARSLGPTRKFQIIFWKRENEPMVAYPEKGLGAAASGEVDAATAKFADMTCYGATDFKATLEKAVASQPSTIIIATAKSFFGEENLAIVQATLKGTPVKIHTFALGDSDNPVLKQIAQQTDGEYHAFDLNQLKAWTQ